MRDSRGRFASTPGGGKKAPSGLPKRSPRKAGSPPSKRRGLVTQRAAVRRASAKLKGLDTSGSYSGALRQRGQKAAVTRATNKLKAAEATGRRRIAGGKLQGVVRMGANRARVGASRQGESVKTQKPAARPKRQTKRQRTDAYIERIRRIGEGRTGAKAARAERVKREAARYAEMLARFHKRQTPKTREELKKGLSEALGDRKRMRKYADFFLRHRGVARPQSGKRSLIRPGQIERAKGRLGRIGAAVRAPYSSINPNPARQDPVINMRSKETLRMASEWYQGIRPEGGKAKRRSKPVLMPQLSDPPVKLSYSQRLQAESAKRRYGVKSTGRQWATLSTGERIRTTGRSLRKAARKQTERALRTSDRTRFIGEGPRSRYRQRTFREQFNLFTGKIETTYGKFRKVDRKKARPARKAKLGLRRAQR